MRQIRFACFISIMLIMMVLTASRSPPLRIVVKTRHYANYPCGG